MMYPVVLTETAPEERELYYEDCFGLDEQKVMMLEKADADGELSLQLMQEGLSLKSVLSRAYAAMERRNVSLFRTTPSLRLSTTIISLERRF